MRPHWPTLTILAIALWLFTTTGGGYPLLVVSFVVFLRRGGMMRWHMPRIIIGLAAISICVNTLTTILWLRECDQNDRHRLAMAGIASFGVEQLHPDH
jgi:hypothetical protein